jgi:hypothetical protein
MTGTEKVVNMTFCPAQLTPQETLRANLCSASRAISMRSWRVSSRNRRLRPSAAAARSAAEAPSASGGSARSPMTVISSRSTLICGGAVNQSAGIRPPNQPRSLSAAEAGRSSVVM